MKCIKETDYHTSVPVDESQQDLYQVQKIIPQLYKIQGKSQPAFYCNAAENAICSGHYYMINHYFSSLPAPSVKLCESSRFCS